MYSLSTSFWIVPLRALPRDPLLLGDQLVEAEQHGGRGVDRHGRRHRVEGDAREQGAHVVEGVDGHADLADLARRDGLVGVVPHLGGQVERHGQARGAGREVLLVAGVGLRRGAEPGVLAHGPGPAGVHRGVDARACRECPGPPSRWPGPSLRAHPARRRPRSDAGLAQPRGGPRRAAGLAQPPGWPRLAAGLHCLAFVGARPHPPRSRPYPRAAPRPPPRDQAGLAPPPHARDGAKGARTRGRVGVRQATGSVPTLAPVRRPSHWSVACSSA